MSMNDDFKDLKLNIVGLVASIRQNDDCPSLCENQFNDEAALQIIKLIKKYEEVVREDERNQIVKRLMTPHIVCNNCGSDVSNCHVKSNTDHNPIYADNTPI